MEGVPVNRLSGHRLRLGLVFLAAIVVSVVLSFVAHPAPSTAQTGYGTPQQLPDQTIKSAGSSSSNVPVVAGAATALAMLGGAALYGFHKTHNGGSEYP